MSIYNVNHRGERSPSDLKLTRTFRWLYSTDLYVEVEPFRARVTSVSTINDRNHVAQVDIVLRDSDWFANDALVSVAVEVIMDVVASYVPEGTDLDDLEEAFVVGVDWEDFNLAKEDEKLLTEFNADIEHDDRVENDYNLPDLTKQEAIHLIKELKLFRANQQIRVKRSAIPNMFLD